MYYCLRLLAELTKLHTNFRQRKCIGHANSQSTQMRRSHEEEIDFVWPSVSRRLQLHWRCWRRREEGGGVGERKLRNSQTFSHGMPGIARIF